MSIATERLELSRARLREAMSPPPAAPASGRSAPASWWRRFGEFPLLDTVVDSVRAWWANHPLQPVAHVAVEAGGAVAGPLAQRNPWTLVAVAAALGAGVAWSRPWRWIFRSALFAGIVPQLASRIVSSLPIESWMTMVGTALSPRAASASPSHPPSALRPDSTTA